MQLGFLRCLPELILACTVTTAAMMLLILHEAPTCPLSRLPRGTQAVVLALLSLLLPTPLRRPTLLMQTLLAASGSAI